MEATMLIYSSLLILFFISIFKLLLKSSYSKNLPPSPSALPVLGHLHLLKKPLHRTYHNLSQQFGPIFSLRFGSQLVVVVSSPSAVEECFTKNDVVLADRPRFTINKYIAYNCTTLATSSYGDHWRNLRRISTVEVLSSTRLNKSTGIRKDEVKILLRKLYKISGGGHEFAKVELRRLFSELTFNIAMRMITGKRYYGEEVAGIEHARQFRELLEEMFAFAGAAYPGDFVPIFKYFDTKGYVKNVKKLGKKTDLFFQGLIDEHRRNKGDSSESGNTVIDHLLSLQESQPEYYTDETIKGLALSIVAAGSHTSAVTIEWAMANLLNHPDIINKIRDEMEAFLGPQLLLDEADLPKLQYLQNTISETYRLYPATPVITPHMSSDYCTVGGYTIPPKTILLVNAWSIHRDQTLWDDPTCFKPERFENKEAYTYKLMPFGVGRRACPGIGLANRIVGLSLGSLIQCFDWKRVGEKPIDMVEGTGGLAMPKLEPLEALCKARPIMDIVLTQAVL
ncbi:Cytochrome P450 [Corchorus olitorius]|uniref:Cytochrome P450 n=1 Tax=Corchorus olitorius TaxID=93759 RepID=A0A1R3K4J1_9ROSI|nr:Cytochrome P450 [Corchorus olitorius]